MNKIDSINTLWWQHKDRTATDKVLVHLRHLFGIRHLFTVIPQGMITSQALVTPLWMHFLGVLTYHGVTL